MAAALFMSISASTSLAKYVTLPYAGPQYPFSNKTKITVPHLQKSTHEVSAPGNRISELFVEYFT